MLTRRVGGTLVIGGDVSDTVLGVKGSQVQIGVDAPKSISVHREEIYESIQREKEAQKEKGDTDTPKFSAAVGNTGSQRSILIYY